MASRHLPHCCLALLRAERKCCNTHVVLAVWLTCFSISKADSRLSCCSRAFQHSNLWKPPCTQPAHLHMTNRQHITSQGTPPTHTHTPRMLRQKPVSLWHALLPHPWSFATPCIHPTAHKQPATTQDTTAHKRREQQRQCQPGHSNTHSPAATPLPRPAVQSGCSSPQSGSNASSATLAMLLLFLCLRACMWVMCAWVTLRAGPCACSPASSSIQHLGPTQPTF